MSCSSECFFVGVCTLTANFAEFYCARIIGPDVFSVFSDIILKMIMWWVKHSLKSLSFVVMSCLSENIYDRTQYDSPYIEELLLNPQTAGLLPCHCTHCSWDINEQWMTSLQDPFCHSCVLLSLQGRVHQSVFEVLLQPHSTLHISERFCHP